MPLVYNELHAMAGNYLRHERSAHTLQCTALVNETYLRLIQMDGVRWQNRAQFFAISAQVVRHILVDHARRRSASKRGANAPLLPLDEALTIPARQDLDVEALDQALDRLEAIDRRKAQIVELRFFAGLSIEEAAEILGCSPTTVKREWKFAKAWLYRDLHG